MPEMLALREMDPRQVGVYRLLGRLGEGGQGVVFLAVDPAGNPAAVKLLPPTTDPQVRSRFLKEVAAAQRVARFCTAQVLDAGIFERRPFIVSEYVSGPSLIEVVEQNGPRGGATLERIAVATLTALGAVHAAGMVHRDFKPANVLLGPDGPVLIDFGLAAVPGMTTMGPSGQAAMGTPAFMAPEQLAAERVTAAADMWSWAVTMAFASTGELPFKGESLTATAFAILHSEPDVGNLPEPLGSLIRRCLNKDPAARPSARGALSELVAAGARLMGPMPPIASVLDWDEKTASSAQVRAALPEPRAGSGEGLIAGDLPSRPHRRRLNRRASRRRRAAVLLSLILLVGGVVGLAFTLSPRGASPELLTGNHHVQMSPLAAEAQARAQAISWILHQVSPGAVVSCDEELCADLVSNGFPASQVSTLGPGANDPLGSSLLVATATVRDQFGGRLGLYAPALIARFGTGNTRIDIWWIYPDGAAVYHATLPGALLSRKQAGAQLLTNSNIRASATARAQLLSGQVDPWLPDLLAILAHSHPVYIVDFASQSPGGGPASLLRWADLATTVPASHLTRAAYLDWMQSFIYTQRAEFQPVWVQQITPRKGPAVLRIGYGAPSPLS
jgi:serine/threonine protein kinase